MCFQYVTFGLVRALGKPEGGRRAEDPFRGLRAGPARSSPRLLPPPTPKPHPMDHTHRRKYVRTPPRKFFKSKLCRLFVTQAFAYEPTTSSRKIRDSP